MSQKALPFFIDDIEYAILICFLIIILGPAYPLWIYLIFLFWQDFIKYLYYAGEAKYIIGARGSV